MGIMMGIMTLSRQKMCIEKCIIDLFGSLQGQRNSTGQQLQMLYGHRQEVNWHIYFTV